MGIGSLEKPIIASENTGDAPREYSDTTRSFAQLRVMVVAPVCMVLGACNLSPPGQLRKLSHEK